MKAQKRDWQYTKRKIERGAKARHARNTVHLPVSKQKFTALLKLSILFAWLEIPILVNVIKKWENLKMLIEALDQIGEIKASSKSVLWLVINPTVLG